MQALGVDTNLALLHGALMLFNSLAPNADNVLTLVVVDQIQILQSGDHVLLLNRGALTDVAGSTANEILKVNNWNR